MGALWHILRPEDTSVQEYTRKNRLGVLLDESHQAVLVTGTTVGDLLAVLDCVYMFFSEG
jgi:hypothetical protein